MFIKLFQGMKISIISFLGALLLRLINASLRWKNVGITEENKHWGDGEEPRIYAFWHNRQLMMAWPYLCSRMKGAPQNFYVLISQHTDGRLIAGAMKYFEIKTVAGSSTRGGKQASRELVNKLKEGCSVVLTPDGPKGPLYKLKNGVVSIAHKTGVPIVPIAATADRRWEFNSWDRMILPKPFSRAVFVIGQPISVPRELHEGEFEEWIDKIEKSLNDVTAQADQYFSSAS